MKKLILLMVVLGASVVLAEERQKVFLIDGSSIEGKTVSATDSTVSIETDIGMMVIKKSKILRIEKISQDQRIVPTVPSDSLYIEQKIDVSFELRQKYNEQIRFIRHLCGKSVLEALKSPWRSTAI